MRVIIFLLILIFSPGLFFLIAFFYGVRYAFRKLSVVPRGSVDTLKYRILPWMIFFIAGFVIFEGISEGNVEVFIIFLITALIAAYQGGFFTNRLRSHRRFNYNAPLPSFRSGAAATTVSTGLDYEIFVKQIILQQGWDVIMTAQSGDQGADLIAERDGLSLAIQCKWLSQSRVGNTAVQEIFTAQAYYNCMYACVVTNAEYTNPAVDLADRTGVALLHHEELPVFLKQMRLEHGIEYVG